MASLLIKSDRDGTDVTFDDNQVITVPIKQDSILSKRTLFELLLNDPKMYQVLNLDDNSLSKFDASTAHLLIDTRSEQGTLFKSSISHRRIAIIKPKSTKVTKANFNSRFFKAIINYLSSGLSFSDIRITDFSILDSTLNDPIPTAIFTGTIHNYGKKPFYSLKFSIPADLNVTKITKHLSREESIESDEDVRIHYASLWAICCNALEVASGKKKLFLSFEPKDRVKLLAAIVGSYGFPNEVKNGEIVTSKSTTEFKISDEPAIFQIVQDQELAREIHSCFASIIQGLKDASFKTPKFVQDDYIREDYSEKMFYAYSLETLSQAIVKVGAYPHGGVIQFNQNAITEIIKPMFTQEKNSSVDDKTVVEELRKLLKMDFRVLYDGA